MAQTREPQRRERQKRDREQRILRGAARYFGTKGYAETAMEDVAASAGLAVGTLYNYFRSKSELLLAILRREIDDLLAAGQRPIDDPPDDPVEAIASVVDAYAGVLASHDRKLWRELLAAAIAEPEAIGRAAFRADAQLVGQLHALLQTLRERGRLGEHVDPGTAAIALYGSYFVWLNVYLLDEDVTLEDLRNVVRRGIETCVRGLFPARGRGEKPWA